MTTPKKEKIDIRYGYIILGFLALAVVPIAIILIENDKSTLDLNDLKNKFPSQNDSLWYAFKSGVDDVVNFDRPSNYILLYTAKSEPTLRAILEDLTKYIYKLLPNNCHNNPLQITHEELSTQEIIRDFGVIIHRYKSALETQCLMIVNNINKTPGKAARAFHNICDQDYPLVEQAVIIFTMEVPQFSFPDEKHVRNILQTSWHEIDNDTFEPLLTRISSMILRIYPEETLHYQNLTSSVSLYVCIIIIAALCVLLLLCIWKIICIPIIMKRLLKKLIEDHPEINESDWNELFPLENCDNILITSVSENDLVNNVFNSVSELYNKEFKNYVTKVITDEVLLSDNEILIDKNYIFLIQNLQPILAKKILSFLKDHKDVASNLKYITICSVSYSNLSEIKKMLPKNYKLLTINDTENE